MAEKRPVIHQLNHKPNVLFSLANALYYATMAILFGYAVVFLHGRGLSNSQAGVVLSLGTLLPLLIQPITTALVQNIASLTLNRMLVIMATISIIFALILQLVGNAIGVVMLLFTLLAAFSQLPTPTLNALAIEIEHTGVQLNYGAARGLGSLGFALTGFAMGQLVERRGAGMILPVFMAFAAVTLVVFLCQPALPAREKKSQAVTKVKKISMHVLLKENRALLLFFLAIAAISYVAGTLDSYQVVIMENVGGNMSDYGILILVAACCELPIMALFNRIRKVLSMSHIMYISIAAFIGKSLVLLFANQVSGVILAQLFNALTNGFYLPGIVYFTNMITTPQQNIVAQALISGMAISFGKVVGMLTGGLMLDASGIPLMMGSCIVVAVVGLCLMRMASKKEKSISKRE